MTGGGSLTRKIVEMSFLLLQSMHVFVGLGRGFARWVCPFSLALFGYFVLESKGGRFKIE